jgi:hypothetical protein
MCRLREVFDPEHRANPGKVVPVHACGEWRAAPHAVRGAVVGAVTGAVTGAAAGAA